MANGAPNPERNPVPASLLGVRAGETNWLLRLDDAGEIMALPELASVPLTQPWYLGLANVRGKLVGAVDLARFAGDAGAARGVESRLVLIADRYHCHCALLVQRLLGLKDTRKMTPLARGQGADTLPGGGPAWMGPAHRDEGGALWKELDIATLVRNEAFLNVGL